MVQIRCVEGCLGFPCLWSDYNSMPGMSCIACSSRDLNNFPSKKLWNFQNGQVWIHSSLPKHLAWSGGWLRYKPNFSQKKRTCCASVWKLLQGVPKCKPPQSGGIGSQAFSSSSTLHVAYLQSNVNLCFRAAWPLDSVFSLGHGVQFCPCFDTNIRRLHNFATILARPSTNISFSPNVWSIFTTNCCHCFQTEGRVYISTMYYCWCRHNIVSETVRDSQKIRAASIC